MSGSWRWAARKVIDPIFRSCMERKLPVKEFVRICSLNYPFGPREMHPYSIWLDEVARWRLWYERGYMPPVGAIPGPRGQNKGAEPEQEGSLFA